MKKIFKDFLEHLPSILLASLAAHFIIEFFFGEGWYKRVEFLGSWLIYPLQIRIFELILYPLVVFGLYYFINKKFNKGNSIYSKKQLKLREFNHYDIKEHGVRYTWEVYFEYNDTPFISDLTVFCILPNHQGLPLRYVNHRCPDYDCPNNKQVL